MKIFKLATYNVNSVRSRLHVIIPWLRQNRPDVLCMQETKVEDGKFPRAEFEQSGYHICFSGGKKGNGVAIASLEEPDSLSCGFGGDAAGHRQAGKGEIFGGLNNKHICAARFQNGQPPF